MITSDPYGISGAVAPWRSLDAMEPIAERRITERDTEEAELFFRAGPCERCSSKSICDAVGGTCSRKERWEAVKEVPNDGR